MLECFLLLVRALMIWHVLVCFSLTYYACGSFDKRFCKFGALCLACCCMPRLMAFSGATVCRDQGGGVLFSSPIERKKVSVKLSGREEGSEGVRKRAPGYGESSSYGGGAKLTGSVVPVGSNGRLKGGNLILTSSSNGGRQQNEELHLERISGTAKSGAEEGILPQWGRGKRSRGSRVEPNSSKHSSSPPLQQDSLLPSKSAPSAFIKKPLANGVSSSKLRSHGPSKLPLSKSSAPERPASRYLFTCALVMHCYWTQYMERERRFCTENG